jgi:hypothetical protein
MHPKTSGRRGERGKGGKQTTTLHRVLEGLIVHPHFMTVWFVIDRVGWQLFVLPCNKHVCQHIEIKFKSLCDIRSLEAPDSNS